MLPPIQEKQKGQRWTSTSSTRGLLSTHAGTSIYGATALFSTSTPRGLQRRTWRQPGNRWRPVIDLSSLNKFLAIPKFKMETPESIRASLRKGEWVTSIDLANAYLHIPIHTQSQKYLRFHFQGVTYQFTSLPFGLAAAPLIFTSTVKEVKLIALQSGIRLHQYLDDWLIRVPSEQECMDQTQKLPKLVKDLGFIVNLSIKYVISARTLSLLTSTEKTVKLARCI